MNAYCKTYYYSIILNDCIRKNLLYAKNTLKILIEPLPLVLARAPNPDTLNTEIIGYDTL